MNPNIKKLIRNPLKIYKLPAFLYKMLFKKIVRIYSKHISFPTFTPLKIAFAGEYYNGNMKAMYEYLKGKKYFNGTRFHIFWVYKNLKDKKRLKRYGVRSLWFYGLWNLKLFLNTRIWFNDRGTGDIPIPHIKGSLWIQLWHGIPFKGFKGSRVLLEDFEKFDIHPVSSYWLKDYYTNAIGVNPQKVVVTGYPREDLLLNDFYEKSTILKELNLPKDKKIILYAPTWSHESRRIKPLFPFGNDKEILLKLERFLIQNNLFMIIRLHPNWMRKSLDKKNRSTINFTRRLSHIYLISVLDDWDTEKYLYIADMLITDWSSIANDYIVLDRPILFLEIPYMLFKFGFALKPEERPGEIIKTEEEFFKAIEENIKHPDKFRDRRRRLAGKIHYRMDGRASERVIEEVLKRLI